MCTAASYFAENGLYFGRTLDYECSYGESVAVVPRGFAFHFRNSEEHTSHYALIGMAHISGNYPLFYEAANEKGLAMAGLNFVGNAVYHEKSWEKVNLAAFEFIPYLLGQCADLAEVRALLEKINLTNEQFSEEMPPAKLHWIISDKSGSIVVESVKEGIFVYDNPANVLTNNPPFPQQLTNLSNYMNLTAKQPENRFCADLPLQQYCKGMGAIGLPGDLSSMSRFVRAAFVLNNSKLDDKKNAVSQFFHILGAVDQQRGSNELEEGKYEITLYTSCIDCSRGIYYYTTYNNHQISAVDMHRENLDGEELSVYPISDEEQISFQN